MKDRREAQDDVYIPMPFLEDQLELQEWLHALIPTVDVCALPKQTKFCKSDGHYIISIRMTESSKQKEPSKEEFHDAKNEMEQDKDLLKENLSQSKYNTPERVEEDTERK